MPCDLEVLKVATAILLTATGRGAAMSTAEIQRPDIFQAMGELRGKRETRERFRHGPRIADRSPRSAAPAVVALSPRATFDISEFQGKDWNIAIHPVYPGPPCKERLISLRSPTFRHNHIAFGRINTGKDAIQYLARNLEQTRQDAALHVIPRLCGNPEKPLANRA